VTFHAFQADGYLVDLDGTLLCGGALLPGARWLVENLRDRFVIVSNDAEHTPNALSHKLSTLGVIIDPDVIILAGTTAIDMLAQEMPGARVMLLASPALQQYARRRGLRLATAGGDVILVGRDRWFTYEKLARAARAAAEGIPLWLACADAAHRGPSGEPVPETGAIGAAIAAAAGVGISCVVGKPEPTLFERACARLRSPPDRVIMIGDNPETDGAGARALGMPFIEVGPGEIGPHLFERETERA
jgi:HAD superfamily hydrolase (TIGR01450 family)